MQINHHKSHLQQKENEWAEKMKNKEELSQQLEAKYKSVKNMESKWLLELQNQHQEKQLETEKY